MGEALLVLALCVLCFICFKRGLELLAPIPIYPKENDERREQYKIKNKRH